uniref:Protein kinase domain-containing protein n=1 Tax=Oryza barthii TaxID=65489 RepID=A0A0D3HSS2_9ORYZ
MTTLPTAILLLLLLLALPPPSAVVALTADGLALLALKAAVTDDPLSVLSSWSETSLIALISIADAAGVALVGVILVYVYWKVKDRKKQGRSSTVAAGDENESRHGLCRCIWGHRGVDSDTDTDDSSASENGGGGGKYGEGELVAIDRGFRVELDELLRSSAYVLGKGGKGIVYKVVVGNGATPVAVRRLGGGGGGGERCKEFAAEARAVGRARHPNVVRLRAYYWSADEKLVVTDFVGNGNLAAAMRGRPGQTPLSWSTRLKIARGAARGLAYLHECSPRRFVHGEVKPSNILLDADFTPKFPVLVVPSVEWAAFCLCYNNYKRVSSHLSDVAALYNYYGRSGQAATLSWSVRLRIAKGAARGLAHLHECSPRRFVHGEVKPSNVLLDADYNAVLADFGLARLLTIAGCADDVVERAPGGDRRRAACSAAPYRTRRSRRRPWRRITAAAGTARPRRGRRGRGRRRSGTCSRSAWC